MGDRMGAVMGFNRASINRLRALGAACVTAAVIAAYWAAWAALVLALAGLLAGVVVPFCLGRSWRGVLGSIALRRLGLAHPNTDSSSVKEGGETERLLSRERGPWTVPFERPAGGAQAPPEAAVLRARSFHTWSLKTRPRDASSEACVRPQNGVRLAAESFSEASAPGKPACPDEAGEVIDFQSVLGNLEKRYRGPHPAGRSHVPEPPSDEGPPVTMDMEEIRRRLRAAYGGRLPGAARQSTSEPRGEVPPRGFTGAREERIGPLASRPATINPSSRGHSETAWEDLRRLRHTGKPEVKLKATGDGAPRTPQESPWGRSMERPTPPATARPLPSSAIPPGRALLAESSRTATMGAPDEATGATLLDRQPDVGEMEPPFSPTHPCKVIVKGGELQCLPLAPEHGVREWSPALPPRTATQVLPSSMGNPVEPSPAAPPAPYVADSQVNSSRPDPCDGPCLPPLSLLHPADSAVAPMSQDDLIEGGILIEEKLAEFRVKVSVQDAYAGPVITR